MRSAPSAALLGGAFLALLSGCAVGPDYARPTAIVPADYKEDGWRVGAPQETADRGPWWTIYDDPLLGSLESEVDVSNQNLKASEAAYREAQAIVAEARAGFFPTISLTGSAQRSGSGGRSSGSVSRGSGGGRTLYDVSAGASWAPDIWGRIRRTVESDVANAQASAADLASARLSAQAALATAYFQLRVADELKRLLDTNAAGFAQSLQIARNQYAAGVAGRSDVVQAQTQLLQTQAQAINTGVLRAQTEHAIAALVGKPPAALSIAPATFALKVPVIPPGVPSSLLERRPDIAATERRVASANAQIGIAVAAFFPDLTLSASVAFSGFDLGKLLQVSNEVWSVGPQLAQTVFDGGLRSARVEQARAFYDQTIATYRQTVLTGFQQVEDQLAALRILAQQAEVEDAAVRSAREAERLVLNQYRAGTVPYTSVITAQATALGNEESALSILQNRLIASISLIEALGGGWNAGELPNVQQVKDGAPPESRRAETRDAVPSP